MRRQVLRVAAGVIAVGLAASCGGKRTEVVSDGHTSNEASCEASERRIAIATGNLGGVYYALGGGLAHLISDNTDLKATAAETGASGQNIQELVAGDYDIAFASADVALDAITGKGIFAGKPQKVQALTRLYPEYMHVLVRTDAGIDSVMDLRGKRVSTGSPKSGSEAGAYRLLRAAGMDPQKDIQAQRLDLATAAEGVKAGRIDALIWTGGLPIARITDITTSLRNEVKFLDAASYLDALEETYPVYERAVIPAETYQQPDDVLTVALPSLLLVREDFPVGDACAITKLIFAKKAELEKVHPAAKGIALDKAAQTEPAPLHPGAIRALRMAETDPGATP